MSDRDQEIKIPRPESPAFAPDDTHVAIESAREAASRAIHPIEVEPTPEERTRMRALVRAEYERRVGPIFSNTIRIDARELEQGLNEFLDRHPDVVRFLSRLRGYHLETFVHLMGVSLMMIALQKTRPDLFSEYDAAEQEAMVLGTLMHDVGKLLGCKMDDHDHDCDPTFDSALRKIGGLDASERAVINEHTNPDKVRGRMDRIAPGWFDRLPPLTQAMIVGHHLQHRELAPHKDDPKVRKAMEMIQMVDIFEAVNSPRAYRLAEITTNPQSFTRDGVFGILEKSGKSDVQRETVRALDGMMKTDSLIGAIHRLAGNVKEAGPFKTDEARFDAYAHLFLDSGVISATPVAA